MSNTAVIYATKTGHSEKLAKAIGEAVGTDAQNVLKSSWLGNAELLFIVGGIYGGKSMPELVSFTKNLSSKSVKRAVLVTSSVSVSKRRQSDIRKILVGKGIDILDEITCPGSLLFVKLGHPNTADTKRIAEHAIQIKNAL